MLFLKPPRDYWGVYECHSSCPGCDPHTTCKVISLCLSLNIPPLSLSVSLILLLLPLLSQGGMTCYNDLAFVEHLVMEIILKELNIDQNRCFNQFITRKQFSRIHASGFSNGAQFTYYLATYSRCLLCLLLLLLLLLNTLLFLLLLLHKLLLLLVQPGPPSLPLASVGVVSGSPLLGFGPLPQTTVKLLPLLLLPLLELLLLSLLPRCLS